ncbi:lysosome membrane protein 2-like [Ruditapes philippinarum]|uniref:lysosome membrane protein 2-like n=1 Tax=Ruditapes philippinarum TaxID=129788 RepID=UPI00295A9C37|nr:lysosome membrane protein 2-like [Ruditapes philippinarum]
MVWSTKKRIVVGNVIGWGLALIGIVMIPLMEFIIKKKVQDTVVIRKGGPVYEYWEDPPVPVYLQIYMFNLTNKEEFLNGQKPSLNQVGPYTYSEKREKFDIVFNENGTVSYRQKRVFTFEPEMSQGNKETDMYLSPNPVYWALYNALKYEDDKVREAIYAATQLFDEHPLMFRSFEEVIWGYHDPLLNVTKVIDPDWFYTDYIGFFMNKNNTDDGVYTVYTGADDINQLGVIDRYNGTNHLDFWSTEWANMINGSDGTIGPPYLPKDITLYTFSSDICRSVPGIFHKTVETSQGIALWRFSGEPKGLANATVNPDNIGFCTPTRENCLGAGLVNISNCQSVDFFHLPVAISLPHFLFGDPRYINAVYGVSPNEEEHNTVIDLEPYTGLVLNAAKRLQINVYLEPLANISETLNIKPVFLPVFWLNESATIDDKSSKKFYRLLFTPLLIIHVTEIVLISLGGFVFLCTII